MQKVYINMFTYNISEWYRYGKDISHMQFQYMLYVVTKKHIKWISAAGVCTSQQGFAPNAQICSQVPRQSRPMGVLLQVAHTWVAGNRMRETQDHPKKTDMQWLFVVALAFYFCYSCIECSCAILQYSYFINFLILFWSSLQSISAVWQCDNISHIVLLAAGSPKGSHHTAGTSVSTKLSHSSQLPFFIHFVSHSPVGGSKNCSAAR